MDLNDAHARAKHYREMKRVGRVCPTDKVGYTDRKRAKKAVKWVQSHQQDKELRIYRCPECGLFHFTSTPARK